jgi:hypothetical protein
MQPITRPAILNTPFHASGWTSVMLPGHQPRNDIAASYPHRLKAYQSAKIIPLQFVLGANEIVGSKR